MEELFDSDFLETLQNLAIYSNKLMNTGTEGNRKSSGKGSSVEFSDYREYAAGDDFRRVDWNAFGRFNRLFVKLYTEEKEAPVTILLDTSKSMDWGEPGKSIVSRRLAAALTCISLSNYDRVTIACINNGKPGIRHSLRGKHSLPKALKFLEGVKYENTTDLYGSLKELNLKENRGISILISDLFTPGLFKDILNHLLFKRQDVHICHILAPQEINPEINRNLRLIDSETGEYRDITASARLLDIYRKKLNAFISDIEKECFRTGVNYVKIDTGMSLLQAIRMVAGRR